MKVCDSVRQRLISNWQISKASTTNVQKDFYNKTYSFLLSTVCLWIYSRMLFGTTEFPVQGRWILSDKTMNPIMLRI